MTRITHLYSPKGGQGCTTVAAMMALACEGETLLVDAAPRHDLPAVLGTFYDPDAGPQRIADRLTLGYGREPDTTNLINGDLNFDQVVIDHSLHEHDGDWSGRTRHQWLIVHGLPDVESWDAIDVGKWAKFHKMIRQLADEGYPYDFIWHLHVNVYEPDVVEPAQQAADRGAERDAEQWATITDSLTRTGA